MKKIISLLLFVSILGNSQTSEFDNYELPGIGYISIPNNMEQQTGVVKKLKEKISKELSKKFNYTTPNEIIVFQQKGLNDLDKNAFSTYSRIRITTDIGSLGDYKKLDDTLIFTEEELKKINNSYKEQVKSVLEKIGGKLIDWKGFSLIKINGFDVMKITYVRKLNNRPDVIVNIHKIQNNDRMYTITFSHRVEDLKIWNHLFDKTINSLQIMNIK